MSKYFLVLQTVNKTVNDFTSKSANLLTMKRNYSEPKIYTGGVDVTQWNKLTSKQKKEALEKDWFIYYSIRDEETGKLKKMPHVKAGVNRYHTKEERFEYLKTVKSALLFLLEKGLNPYKDNDLSNLNLKNEIPFRPNAILFFLDLKFWISDQTKTIIKFLIWGVLFVHFFEIFWVLF